MKIWIIYDSKFGNNKKVAALMKQQLSEKHEVMVNYAKEISPKAVMAAAPDALIFGGPRRIGKISYTLRKWVEKYAKLLTKNNIQLKKVAMWETKGEMKEEDLKSNEGMERKVYEANLKTPDLWQALIQKVPSAQKLNDLLSLIVASPNPEVLSSAVLMSGYEEKVAEFINRFEL